MNKQLEIATAALKVAADRFHGQALHGYEEDVRDALAAIRAGRVACGHMQSGDYFENAGDCRVCAAPVETLVDDAGCQAVVAKALYTYVRDPLVHTLLSDLDAYRAEKRR